MMSEQQQITKILQDIWKEFHPAILWWADERAATDPSNIRIVYRELLSGPKGSMTYAAKLRPYLPVSG